MKIDNDDKDIDKIVKDYGRAGRNIFDIINKDDVSKNYNNEIKEENGDDSDGK